MRQRLKPWVFLVFVSVFVVCSDAPEETNPFLGHLPQAGDAAAWKPADSPQFVEGDDLFLLINGGAEIYHEYGFARAAVQSYEDDSDRSLNLEVYEMEDPAAAYGIFTFKRGKNCETPEIGDESCLQDYYLNVWKGPFLITVVGFDTEAETRKGLIALAEATAQTVSNSGTKPQLSELLPGSSTVYMKGNLALFNAYDFGKGNVFGVEEGLKSDLDGGTAFVFRYGSPDEASRWFETACQHISQEDKFRDVLVENGKLTARDTEGQHLVSASRDKVIVLVIGLEPEGVASNLENIFERLSSAQE
jgi:hypothetical protein